MNWFVDDDNDDKDDDDDDKDDDDERKKTEKIEVRLKWQISSWRSKRVQEVKFTL